MIVCSNHHDCVVLRFDIVKGKMESLGYAVSGEPYNAADFGVPQQRSRAWVLCILRNELMSTTDQLSADMKLFQCPCPPLLSCIDLGKKFPEKKAKGKQGKKGTKPKWHQGFLEQCKIYGKVTLLKLLKGFSFLCSDDTFWGISLKSS